MAGKPKYIFVVGGVMSGVGKGVATSSIGKILQSRGYEVTALKIDPYVNVDAGTMNPTEHGEVFVLDDGTECDQDMGNYERFLNRDFTRVNYMTTGSVYLSVIQKERNLEYGGKNVEVVPHIPLEVIDRINKAIRKNKADIAVVEIGGTVGEYQNILFLEAIRMLKLKNPGDVLLALVSYLPSLGAGGTELKTKPTQYAVRSLNAAGLQPDVVLARANEPLDKKRKEKIAINCSMAPADVLSAPNVKSVYEVPLNFEKEKISDKILGKLNLKPRKRNLGDWKKFVSNIKNARKEVKIALVGKYFGSGNYILEDSYISVIEALKHAAAVAKVKPVLEWINAEEFDPQISKDYQANLKKLSGYNGILVPGGFGSRGVEGKIRAIKFARENKTPFFGLCYGMQLAVVEFARHKLGIKDAHTAEIDRSTKNPVIDVMPEQIKNLDEKKYGGTMRLGTYPAALKSGSIAQEAYRAKTVNERHRHRYEVNPKYVERLEKKGMVFSGVSPDRKLMEIMELPKNIHPFFLGTQFHPEFKSRPLSAHPLFVAFMRASAKTRK